MSNLEDTKAQIPSVFWTIANGVFLASGIALIVMRNDYLWGIPQIIAGLFGLATMFLIKKPWCAQLYFIVSSLAVIANGLMEIFGIIHGSGYGYVPLIIGIIVLLFIGLDKDESSKALGIAKNK